MDTADFASSMQGIYARFPAFSRIYFGNLFGLRAGDTLGYGPLKAALSNRYIREVSLDIDSVYPGLDGTESAFAGAFTRYEKEFPGQARPAVYTYPASLSGFQPAVWNADSILAIGIDCFLGSDYYFYQTTNYPRYMVRRFTPAHLVPTALKGFLQYHFPAPEEGSTFLSSMLYEGKILYLLDRMLPDTPDSLKIGYTSEEIKWAEAYERDIWAYFIEQDLLYAVDGLKYSRYLAEAPFTSDLGADSAPRIGAFAGWRIVRQYMEEHPGTTPPQLMAEQDAQKILRLSGYKPK